MIECGLDGRRQIVKREPALLFAFIVGFANLFAGGAEVHEADVLAIFARSVRTIDDPQQSEVSDSIAGLFENLARG